MYTTRARNVFRAVAAVLGLVGVLDLSIAIPFDTKAGTFGVIFSSFFALLGLYLLYVAYLCWWRLSPRVVRHVCAASAFCLLGVVGFVLERFEPVLSQGGVSALTLLGFTGIVWAYFRASKYVTRLVFGERKVQSSSQ
jgi:hypothetical protein